MMAPVESVTLPSIELLNCANAADALIRSMTKSHKCLLNLWFIVSPRLASMDQVLVVLL
jgi:hypothetical protein